VARITLLIGDIQEWSDGALQAGDSRRPKLLPLTFSEQRSKAVQDPPMTPRTNRRIASRPALTPPLPGEQISR